MFPVVLHKEHCSQLVQELINTLRLRQNGRHFPDDIFKLHFLDDNVQISIKISLKFVPNGPINDIPALVQIMAWHQPGDKPLSIQIMLSLLTHKCITLHLNELTPKTYMYIVVNTTSLMIRYSRQRFFCETLFRVHLQHCLLYERKYKFSGFIIVQMIKVIYQCISIQYLDICP